MFMINSTPHKQRLILAVALFIVASGTVHSQEGNTKQSTESAAEASMEDRWRNTKKSAQEFWKDFKYEGQENWSDTKAAFREGMVAGKLEMAIITNEHLNPFDINIDVKGNTVTLQGTVDSAVEVELAEAIAYGIEGIDKVDNQLQVDPEVLRDNMGEVRLKARSFMVYLNDLTLTAKVKTALIQSPTISASTIDVDVFKGDVILLGTVKQDAERSLAEELAQNVAGVSSVTNKLEVSK